jgi:hypothetical protein
LIVACVIPGMHRKRSNKTKADEEPGHVLTVSVVIRGGQWQTLRAAEMPHRDQRTGRSVDDCNLVIGN